VPERWTFRTSEASARYLRDLMSNIGVLVVGRRLFDYTHGWRGKHPFDVPVFVVTHSVPKGSLHEDAPFTFVTEGVESAITQAKPVAGEGWVGVAGPNVAQQCLNAGLIDELRIYPVPVLLGEGIPFSTSSRAPP